MSRPQLFSPLLSPPDDIDFSGNNRNNQTTGNTMEDASFASDRIDLLSRIEMEELGDVGPRLNSLLFPHPEDDLSSSPDSPRLVGGSDYLSQNLHMAICFLTLLAGYTVQRIACKFGLPYDCLRAIDYFEFFNDITSLGLYGVALGWFIGIAERSRFAWLFSRKRWYAAVIYLAVPPVYSAISNFDVLKHDLVDMHDWGFEFIFIWLIGMGAASAVVGWHIWAVWRRASRASFAVYLAVRLGMLTWFAISAAILAQSKEAVHIHLHHLYIGWALALWADLNEPLSAVTLAVGAGIFVQGVGAYSFAPVFSSLGCFETPAAKKVACKFWSDAPFTLQVCGSGGAAAEHACEA